ncbi:MAG: bifunctional nuclease family protein [bacterium]
MIEMNIKGLAVDPLTNVPIVILEESDGDRVLPIWVGLFEAHAIAREMENFETPRPMTHDLLKNLITELNSQVDHILVNELKDNTFYAQIHVSNNGTSFIIDSRPSDAIALAIRVGSPIYVNEKVLDEAKSIDFDKPIKLDENQDFPSDVKDLESPESSKNEIEEDKDKIKDWLKNLKPGDFLKEDS